MVEEVRKEWFEVYRTPLEIRHSRVGGNPAKTKVLQSGQNNDVVPLSREFLNNWTPACAGVTKYELLEMPYSLFRAVIELQVDAEVSNLFGSGNVDDGRCC